MADADAPQFRSLEREVREKHLWRGKDKARAVRALPTAIASRKSSDGALGETARDRGGLGDHDNEEGGFDGAQRTTPVDQVLAELGEIVRTRTLTESQRRDLGTYCSASNVANSVPTMRAWLSASVVTLVVGFALGRTSRP